MTTMSTATARPEATLPPGTPVITGWSAVSPYGIGREEFAAGVRAGAKTAVEAGETSSIVEANLDKLTEILARKAAPPA